MEHDLSTYIKFVGEHFKADDKSYPSLVGKNDEERRAFLMQHLIQHFALRTGKIAATFEIADHGGEFRADLLKIELARQFINILKMADLLGMTEEEFAQVMEKKYGALVSEERP